MLVLGFPFDVIAIWRGIIQEIVGNVFFIKKEGTDGNIQI